VVVFPALAVMIAVLTFNLLGDAWRDWLDPRTAPNSKSPPSPAKLDHPGMARERDHYK
jgi:hypothetical protein